MSEKAIKRTIQTRLANVHVREAAGGEAESRTIAGYAILFDVESDPLWEDNTSEAREIIDSGAITQELLDASDIKFTMYHNRQAILARSNKGVGTLSYAIDAKGVSFEFEAPRTARGDEALELVRRGDLTGCSFAFTTYYFDPEFVSCETDKVGDKVVDRYRVKKITGVYDFTLAADPAYSSTSVEARELATLLRGGGKNVVENNKIEAQVMEMRTSARKNIKLV